MKWKLTVTALILFAEPALAAEGFWPFSALPIEKMNAELGVVPSGALLRKVEQATLQLGRFCTASLAGPNGLLLTNYHCISSCLQDISKDKEDLVAEGFTSNGSAEERQCPGLFAERPLSDMDVTERFNSALKGLSGKDYADRLKREMSAVIAECLAGEETKTCRVVRYFNDAVFRLQSFKVYRDVRMVFAPEFQSALFGGDPDNFDFPRFGFDMALLRLYEDGLPAPAEGWLSWRNDAPRDGEALIIAGYPGFTFRHFTVSQIRSMRDGYLPWFMTNLSELRGRLIQFSDQRAGSKPLPSSLIYEVENSLKKARGQFEALADADNMAIKENNEIELRNTISVNPELSKAVGSAFEEIAAGEVVYRQIYWQESLRYDLTPSVLWRNARELVAAIRQMAKPADQRDSYYIDENLPTIEQSLFTEIIIDAEVERLALAFGLSKLREYLGTDHSLVRNILGKESPESLARRVVNQTKLGDSNERKKIFRSGLTGLESSEDPLLRIAALVDDAYKALDKRYMDEVDAPQVLAHQRIAVARNFGSRAGQYPDADSSLRLSYGRISGWTDRDGSSVDSCTLVKDLAQRATDHPPYQLPRSWRQSMAKLDMEQPFNCATTHDMIGGNSGSPVIDGNGEIVGLVFDGNFPSLGGTYVYEANRNRAIMLSGRLIQDALRVVYRFPLTGK